jgi:hypothetical protein
MVSMQKADLSRAVARLCSDGYEFPCCGRDYAFLTQTGLPKAVIDRAWDAQLRLCKRYRKLTARGKHRNVAVVAIARELAGFIWDIARMTPITAAVQAA